jgi:ribonuclease E
MLIDAMHAEETRVVVVRGHRLEEFDFESSNKKQLKGNIYLAKVTRVEPSLQAAFVEYGGNRHGFLAFNEIHPDYYQIPVADRQALLAEEAQHAADEAADEDDGDAAPPADAAAAGGEANAGDDEAGTAPLDASTSEEVEAENGQSGDNGAGEEAPGTAEVVASSNPDALDEVPRPRARPRRSYKIQEVIKKRQILLVQVVKEERGNKGAALTTYMSLAGRYCVLMPNTARGGGISRKIANMAARKKLKSIVADLDVPDGMGVIVRTAGMNRTKSEIKRDYEYLLRVWDEVRETTLKSTAPALVYEEASLIKRAIRDLYTKDIDEILVEGADGYRMAKDFMRMMQPSHAKKVQHYDERVPLFHRYQIEQQLDSMHSNVVQLKSGGYVVINSTEALVAIDVNSGRSTREHNIEETALKTNLEASDEIARQLRLRDLAGLIVIDYIDMEDNRNNRAVERRLSAALKLDRARIQVGRISSFGLLEMSRQRLRPSLFEASMVACAACNGSGFVRSTESTVLHVLRAIEDRGVRGASAQITVHVPTAVAIYILNQKREVLNGIEHRYEMHVLVYGDDTLVPPEFRVVDDITRAERPIPPEIRALPTVDDRTPVEEAADDDVEEAMVEEARVEEAGPEAERGEDGRRRRRRRRRNGRRREEETEHAPAIASAAEEQDDDAHVIEADEAGESSAADGDADARRGGRRRRGRRGGRRRREGGAPTPQEAAADPQHDEAEADTPEAFRVIEPDAGPFALAEPDFAAHREEPHSAPEPEPVAAVAAMEAEPEFVGAAALAEPAEVGAAEPAPESEPAPEPEAAPEPEPERHDNLLPFAVERTPEPELEHAPEPEPVDDRPKRRGWWSRRD